MRLEKALADEKRVQIRWELELEQSLSPPLRISSQHRRPSSDTKLENEQLDSPMEMGAQESRERKGHGQGTGHQVKSLRDQW